MKIIQKAIFLCLSFILAMSLTQEAYAEDTSVLYTSSGSKLYNGPYSWGCWISGYPQTQSDGSYLYAYDTTSSTCTDGYGGSSFVLTSDMNVSSSIQSVKITVKKSSSYNAPSKLKFEFKSPDGQVTAVYLEDFGSTSSYTTVTIPFTFSGTQLSEVVIVADQKEKAGFYFKDVALSTDCPETGVQAPALTSGPSLSDVDLLDKTEADAALYFYQQTLGSYGMVKDSMNNSSFTSIAATGFGLSTLAVLAERYGTSSYWNTVTPDQAKTRAQSILSEIIRIQGLQTSNPAKYGTSGFLFHFLNADSTAYSGSEVSSVDNALLLAGVIQVGEYWSDLKDEADSIFNNMKWSFWFRDDGTGQKWFYMSYHPSTNTFDSYKWDRTTDELFLINILALAQDPDNAEYLENFYRVSRTSYLTYNSSSGTSYSVYNSYFGSLFTYFFARPWVDFKSLGSDRPDLAGLDYDPVDWHENSKVATQANRQYCIDLKTECGGYDLLFSESSWGLAACERPDGSYEGLFGAPPQEGSTYNDACATYAALSTLPFFKEEDGGVLTNNPGFQVLRNFYDTLYENIFGPYGPYSSFDINMAFSVNHLGIELGPMALMMENYRSTFLQDTFMAQSHVSEGLAKLFGHAPQFDESTPSTLEVKLGGSLSQQITVEDLEDEDTISVTITNAPTWASFTNTTRSPGVTYTTLVLSPTEENSGYTNDDLPVTINLNLKADDGYRQTEKAIAVTLEDCVNSLLNGDASSGTSSWQNYGATVLYEGDNPFFALKNSGNYLYQDLAIPSGSSSLSIQALARYTNGSAKSGKPYLYAYVMDSNNKILQYLTSGTSGSSTTWATLSINSSVNSSGKKLRVFLKRSAIKGNTDTNEADFDDVGTYFDC
ncbi:MAG: hypothetical protein HYS08_02245 [Chlamydiae bacterium]|nr:hypothetical protein [Chlamydiota bacterium]MBI3266696.1 hypothetical protein [Chlamydiota bacterium]